MVRLPRARDDQRGRRPEGRPARETLGGRGISCWMRLETHEGLIADPVTTEDVPWAVIGLTAVGEAYVILSGTSDDEWYVQGAGTLSEGFIIERRDGCAGEHYRGDRRVSAAELIGILVSYVRGATDWSHGLTWHQVRVDFGAIHAQA